MMKKIGITGQAGFIGTHLFNAFSLLKDEFSMVPFLDSHFDNPALLEDFVRQCDAIIHLAALNRHHDPQTIYDTNLLLVRKLLAALDDTGSRPHLLFSSSTQEERDNAFGRSKREGREMLAAWCKGKGCPFTGLVIPNVYGPFGNPYYNSVVATFSHQLAHGEQTRIDIDAQLKLIYIGELAQVFIGAVREASFRPEVRVQHTAERKVSDILGQLTAFHEEYARKGMIPALADSFSVNLFNTFRSYMDIASHFPVALKQHTDDRGSFTETIRTGTGGQFSFSTTKPGITRGNHFHTRKIERFAVIRGRAEICLRRIGTNEVLQFKLDGDRPSYVDMPVWYTHYITNTGHDDLYTLFWINEAYDPADPDTFFEKV